MMIFIGITIIVWLIVRPRRRIKRIDVITFYEVEVRQDQEDDK